MARMVWLTLLLLAVAAFAAANWAAFITPQPLTLGFVEFTAPLGLLMLLVTALVAVVFLTALAVWQAGTMAAFRRLTRELDAQKVLAEEAETSRFTTLNAATTQDRERIEARLAASEAALRTEISDGINSLAAMLAELDNRLHGEAMNDDAAVTSKIRGPRS